MEKKSKQKNRGFTLVEVLLIVFILAVLVAALSFTFSNIPKKTRDRRGMSDLRAIVHALEMKYNDDLHYPNLPDSETTIKSTINTSGNPLSSYLPDIPQGNGVREYFWKDDGTSNPQNFCVYFQLEVDPSKYFSCTHSGCRVSDQKCPF
jgi:prepilin-type N-terminal cleavage/methylation domain-containing protein